MSDDDRGKRSGAFTLPVFAAACAVAALLLLTSGAGGTPGLWSMTGLTLAEASAYIGFGCSVLAVVSGILALRQRHRLGIAVSILALLLAVLVIAVPLYYKTQARPHPQSGTHPC